MGRKPKKGLREAILAEASQQPSSATMIHEALEARHGAEATTLTGVIKAAAGLRDAGLLRASEAMPAVYRGARKRTFYSATPKGIASLKNAIASATSDWDGAPKDDATKRVTSKQAAPAAERSLDATQRRQRKKHEHDD